MAIDQRSIGRDVIIVSALTELLTGGLGVNMAELLTPEEEAKSIGVASMLTEYHGDDAAIIAESKALLREHLDRILSVEVADSGEDNAQ